MEGGFQVQREQSRRQAFDAKLVEAMTDVADVAEADVLRLSDHGDQETGTGRDHGTGASEDLPGEAVSALQAEGAEPHLDLLA